MSDTPPEESGELGRHEIAERSFATRRAALGMTALATAGFLADRALSPDSARAEEPPPPPTRTQVEAVLTRATANTFLGEGALPETGTGADNTAIGAHALAANTTGIQSVALGAKALAVAETAQSNTAVGYEACSRLTTGKTNTAIGHLAGKGITTGEENVAIGANALISITHEAHVQTSVTGIKNTAVGNASMQTFQKGERNTALGCEALTELVEGSKNVALGYGALGNAVGEGSGHLVEQNTAVGVNALVSVFPAEAEKGLAPELRNNTALGYAAGQNNEGSGNVFLGAFAGASEKGSNKLYIASTSTATPIILGEMPNVSLGLNAAALGFNKKTPVTLIAESLETGALEKEKGGWGFKTEAQAAAVIKFCEKWSKFMHECGLTA
jgi:hypothetical protein